MTFALAWVASAVCVGLIAGSYFHARGQAESREMMEVISARDWSGWRADRQFLEGLLESERARVEVLSRLLDQYRAEGVQNPSWIDYGEPTPPEMEPLPKEAQEWLSGLEPEVREEYEGFIRSRLREGDALVDVLISLSTLA